MASTFPTHLVQLIREYIPFDFHTSDSTPEILEHKFKERWPDRTLNKLRFLHHGYSFHSIARLYFIYDEKELVGLESECSWQSNEQDYVNWFNGHTKYESTQCPFCRNP